MGRNRKEPEVPNPDPRRDMVLHCILFDDTDALRKADLTYLDLSDADLWGANFQQLDLRGCRFARANLFGVDMRCADLRDCDFADTCLDNVNLIGAVYNRTTRFPRDFEPAMWWMILADAEEDADPAPSADPGSPAP
jgi:uncharacterized protein YjbI with pentapeptide repeats